jgi:hypothetical protein
MDPFQYPIKGLTQNPSGNLGVGSMIPHKASLGPHCFKRISCMAFCTRLEE